MFIEIPVLKRIDNNVLIAHFAMCQNTLDSIIGFVSIEQWNDLIQEYQLNEQQENQLHELWQYIKTNNRKKPPFYSFIQTTESTHHMAIQQLIAVKITSNGYYCPSLVQQAHQNYCMQEQPLLEQLDQLSSLTKILSTNNKNNKKRNNNQTNQKNKQTKQSNNRQATTINTNQESIHNEQNNKNTNNVSKKIPFNYEKFRDHYVQQQSETDNEKKDNIVDNPSSSKAINHHLETNNSDLQEFRLWIDGVEKLISHGKNEQAAKRFIGKQIKDFNETLVTRALKKLPYYEQQDVGDVYSFLVGIIRNEQKNSSRAQQAKKRRTNVAL